VQQHLGERRRYVIIRLDVVAERLEPPGEIGDSQCRGSHVDTTATRAEIHGHAGDSNARQKASGMVGVTADDPWRSALGSNLAPFGRARRHESRESWLLIRWSYLDADSLTLPSVATALRTGHR